MRESGLLFYSKIERGGVRVMLLIVSLILIGIMCSMRIVSLHMIERQKIEERYVYCPKCDTKIRKGNSAPFCSKCKLIF